jgi:tetratricopeptide (TPR) repeat protein
MIRRLSLSILALFCLAAPRPAIAAVPGTVASERRALDAAVTSSNSDALLAARNRLAALSAAEPNDPTWHYWTAVAAWRTTPLLMRADKKGAQQVCKDGILHAERLVTLDPKHAEGWALIAGLEGLSLSFAPPMAGMTLGPKMEEQMRRAMTLGPENPRVYLLQGINTFHKPGFVGGGPERALPILEHAEKLFAAEVVADSTAPAWGRDDAYLWAGQAEMGLKHYGEAREAYRKALEANPDNAWVRARLLPEAEKALATAATSSK